MGDQPPSGDDSENAAARLISVDPSTPKDNPFSRLWVLAVFCLAAIMQAATWNVFSPIADSMKLGYGEDRWSSGFISWSANTANITFLISLYPTSAAVKRFGPRKVTVFSAALILGCAAIRCIPVKGIGFNAIAIGSMVLNGASGGWLNFGGPILSEIWFPPNQRNTATAAMSVASYLGGALGFVMGPVFAPDGTTDSDTALSNVRRLFLVEAALAAAVLVGAVLHFPDQPEIAPSASASMKRNQMQDPQEEDTHTGLMQLLTCSGGHSKPGQLRRFWALAFCMGLPLGIFQAWTSVLSLNLKGFISEDAANWLGCAMTVSGCAGSIVVGTLMDRFAGWLKTAALALMTLATLGFGLFAVCVGSFLPISHSSEITLAYISGIWGGFFFNCSIPLFFEITMETIFGWASESVASSTLVMVNTWVQIIFLMVPTKIGGSSQWMNWLNFGLFLASTIPLLLVRVEYVRSEVDTQLRASKDQEVSEKPGAPDSSVVVARGLDCYGCL